MKQERLPWGQTKFMSEEEYRQYRRNLQARWRRAHPEWVKYSNKKWAEIYSKTKPFECICKKCGKKFNASRNSQKSCPECVNLRHLGAVKKREDYKVKIEKKQKDIQQILVMARMGIKQRIIADALKMSQSGISQIMRKHGFIRVEKIKKGLHHDK